MLYRLSYVGTFLNNHLDRMHLDRMERVMGIEPTPSAWKAEVLPLNYTRSALEATDRILAVTASAEVGNRKMVEGVGFEPT